jgi:hypothetical protein
VQSPSVFQVSGSDLFDSVANTQGGLPHLVQFLWDAYCVYLQEQLDLRRVEGKTTVSLEDAKKKVPAVHFGQWATKYLTENRVAETFFVDANCGVRLTNNKMAAICPGAEIRGTMQDSHDVAVTTGRSQPGNNGVTDESGGAFKI